MKRTVSLLALLAALCCLFTVSAAAADAPTSGTCGENLTWTLDGAGTLTISGTGAMEDFVYYDVRWNGSYSSVKAVVIESGVTTIGNCAFMHFTSLTSVTFAENSKLTTIGDNAFSSCPSLTSITIPESVISIGNFAFDSCTSLTGINIPESVTSIGENAFSYCQSLTDVSITDMDAWCRIHFEDAYATPMRSAQNIWLNGQKIVSVTVPEGITEVKPYTFCGFKDLIQVVLPESVTAIGEDAFGRCRSLTSVTFAENSKLTTIGDNAFSSCTSLTGITIPDGVTTIGEYAFSNCSSLTNITIPASVTSIGSNAFDRCKKLAEVSITDLDAWCRINFAAVGWANPMAYKAVLGRNGRARTIYLSGQKVVSVTVPEGITEVKAYTFCGFKDLIQVTIPESVTSIGECAFSNCSSLTNITIPASVTSIDAGAFWDCTTLTNIAIPEGVTCIGESAFMDCSTLTGITIPASVTSIGDYAFLRCSSLTDVYYAGSEEEWNAMTIGTGNDQLKNANIHYIPAASIMCDKVHLDRLQLLGAAHVFAVSYDEDGRQREVQMLTPEQANDIHFRDFKDAALAKIIFLDEAFQPIIADISYEHTPGVLHNYQSSVTREADCRTEGIITYTCTKCGDVYTETIPTKNHHYVTDAAVPATCQKTGLTEGSHCDVCGQILVEQVLLPKTEHKTKDYICQYCGLSIAFDELRKVIEENGSYSTNGYTMKTGDVVYNNNPSAKKITCTFKYEWYCSNGL